MGNDAVLLWLSEELAFGYWVAVLVGMIGVLQFVAHKADREDLRWLPRRFVAPIGASMILIALTWFYVLHYGLIFVPGPAGLELMVLFGAGTVLAAWLTRLLGWVRVRR